MTPEERAEKISKYCALPVNDLGQNITRREWLALVAAEIRAAKDEGYEEAAAKAARGLQIAINATYEDAAKIAEDYGSEYRFNSDAEAVEFEGMVARIRARAKEIQ